MSQPMQLPTPVREAPAREDEELALLWGTTKKAAHTLKTHAARRAADVIRLRRAKCDIEGAAAYAKPLEEVMAALPLPEAQHREAITDAEEDCLQEAYRAAPGPQTAKALLRKRAAMRAASLDDDLRIAAEWGLQP